MPKDEGGRRRPGDEARLKALGARIRELRRARGINQDDFAAMADVPRAHMGLVENGKVDVRYTTLARIADALKVTLPELILPKKDAVDGRGDQGASWEPAG